MRTALLAAALLLTACDSQPPKTLDELNQIVRITDEAVAVIDELNAGASRAAVHEAMGKLNSALALAGKQIDGIARRVASAKYYGRGSIDPRNLSSCVDYIRFSAATGMKLPMDGGMTLWLRDVMECVRNARTYFESASGEDAAAVALAITVIYPFELVAEARFGMAAESTQNQRNHLDQLITRFEPQCSEPAPAQAVAPPSVSYRCAAYRVALSARAQLAALATRLPRAS